MLKAYDVAMVGGMNCFARIAAAIGVSRLCKSDVIFVDKT
jgi:hypothetical protein